MAELLLAQVAGVPHPIELQRPSRPFERLVAVPGIPRASEGQHGSGIRRHLDREILDVVRRAQQPEPPALGTPVVVDIEQHGHQLAGGIGMDLAVAGSRLAADGDHRRVLGQRQVEFLAQQGAHRLALDLVAQPLEGRAETERG